MLAWRSLQYSHAQHVNLDLDHVDADGNLGRSNGASIFGVACTWCIVGACGVCLPDDN